MVPLQVTGDGIERLNDVARLRHIQDAAIDQRRAFLSPRRQRPRPDHPQVVHIFSGDLVQRAVAPAVERAAPCQPVSVRGVLEDSVRDGDELGGGWCLTGCRHRHQGQNRRGHGGARQTSGPMSVAHAQR